MFFYSKFLIGNRTYQQVKKTFWVILFGLNTMSCILFGTIFYGLNLFQDDSMLLLIITVLSAVLSALLTIKFISKNITSEKDITFELCYVLNLSILI